MIKPFGREVHQCQAHDMYMLLFSYVIKQIFINFKMFIAWMCSKKLRFSFFKVNFKMLLIIQVALPLPEVAKDTQYRQCEGNQNSQNI